MTMSLVVEHFDDLLVTPEDVEQLNRAILQLAVEGKLVKQDPHDEPARELLDRLRSLPKQEYRINRKVEEESTTFELFAIPQTWEWVMLGTLDIDISDGNYGEMYPKSADFVDNGVPFIRGTNIKDYYIDASDLRFITEEMHQVLTRGHLKLNDILIVTRGDIGKTAIVTEEFVGYNINAQLVRINTGSHFDPKYFIYCLSSTFCQNEFQTLKTGSALQQLPVGKLRKLMLPMPPLAEQQRIAARVEELFAQTRALAKELAHSQIELDGLNKSALSHLLASETPEEFNQHWDFIAEHFDLLFQTPEHVAPLRQSILELAVRGKLTQREAGDESAGELLKRVRKDKKESSLPSIKDSEKSYELPVGWEWVRFGEIGEQRLGKMLDGSKNKGDYYPYLRNINVQWLRIDLFNVNQMRYELDEIDEYKLQPNDLLICEGGEPGRCAIWESNDLMMFQKAIHRVRPYNGIVSKYLLYHLWGDAGNGVLAKYFTGATIKHFTGKALANYVCALPPVAEQERIVKRVEQLLSLCDALEARLQSAEEERGRLVAAVMSTVGG